MAKAASLPLTGPLDETKDQTNGQPAKPRKPHKQSKADPELLVMARLDRQLRDLSQPAKARVLRWLNERHQEVKPSEPNAGGNGLIPFGANPE